MFKTEAKFYVPVEHVDQQSIDCGDGAAVVVAARARKVLIRCENCILKSDEVS